MPDSQTDHKTVRCAHCDVKIRVPASAAGKKAKCPKCAQPFRIPAGAGAAGASRSRRAGGDAAQRADGRIRFFCEQCNSKVKAPAGAAGRRVKCPSCAAVLTVPGGVTTQVDDEPLGSDVGEEGLFDDLLAAEQTAQPAAPAQVVPTRTCPSCGVAMPVSATVCVSCGYNTATGRMAQRGGMGATMGGLLSGASGLFGGLARRGGPFAMGCALSFVGAMIGAVIWYMVAIQTGYEIGWIAWGLGLLAGLGMAIGNRGGSALAGVVAAGIAVVGIVAAKAFIIFALAYAFDTGDTSSTPVQRIGLAGFLAEQALDERGVFDEEERDAQMDEAYDQAEKRVEALSDDEVETRWREAFAEINKQPLDESQRRLVNHNADRRAQVRGLSPYSEERDAISTEEEKRVRAMSQDELKTALADLDAWDEHGLWDDADAVRDELVYAYVNQAVDDKYDDDHSFWEEERDFTPAEWKEFYESATAKADALSADERVAELRTIRAAEERQKKLSRLAYHRATRAAMRQGLSYTDSRRGELRKEQVQAVEQLSDGELDTEINKLDNWEESAKWSDPQFLHDQLIYAHVDTAAAREARDASERGEEADEFEIRTNGWDRLYSDAVEYAESVSPLDRKSQIEQLEAEHERVADELYSADDEELAGAGVTFLSLLVASMLDWLSVLCVVLAIASAYRVGASDIALSG